MRKKIAFAVSKRRFFKFRYGLEASAVLKTGLADIIPFRSEHLFKQYEIVIVFYNKFPEIQKKHETPVVWWMGDLRQAQELQTGSPTNFDAIFLCQSEALQQYKETFGVPCFYMPQIGTEANWKKGRKIDWDVVFIGSTVNNIYHYNRDEILKALAQRYRVHVINGEKTSRDQVWIYNKTPFSLSVSLPVAGYTSNRLYNIIASGGFALVSYFPEIERIFDNHKHLVWFHHPEEALELLDFYSKNEEKCKGIRENARLLYCQKHCARERIINILDNALGKDLSFRGYL